MAFTGFKSKFAYENFVGDNWVEKDFTIAGSNALSTNCGSRKLFGGKNTFGAKTAISTVV
jgi:hypothetical protein